MAAMRHDVVAYRPNADRTRILKTFVRASDACPLHWGAVGEIALLDPAGHQAGRASRAYVNQPNIAAIRGGWNASSAVGVSL